MKRLHSLSECHGTPAKGGPGNVFKRVAAGTATGIALLLSPALMKPAQAQDNSPAAANPASARPDMRGDSFPLADGKATLPTSLVFEERSMAPSAVVDGPATLVLRFYPILSVSELGDGSGSKDYAIRYTVDGERREQRASSRASSLTSPIVGESSTVGSPVDIRVEVPAGSHEVAVQYPNGFVQAAALEAANPPAPEPEPARPVPAAKPAQGEAPAPAPAKVAEHGRRPFITLEGERAPLGKLGASEAETNSVLFSVNIPVSKSAGVLAGGMFSSYGFRLEEPDAQTESRSYSGDVLLGLSLQGGKHYAYAAGFAGYRGVNTEVLSIADGRTLDETVSTYELGGVAGYRYGHYASARLQGGNSPINPLSLRLYGAVPYTWAEGVYPGLDIDLLWLHALAPREAGYIGGGHFDENALHFRALGSIPVYRLGPVVPVFVAGGELNAAQSGGTSGTGIFGFAQAFEIKALGAATLHGEPLMLLEFGYSR